MEWQPIDTADKTSKESVLLSCPRRGVVIGRWDSDEYAKNPRPYWTNDKELLFGVRATRNDQPTHWMPKPAPASAQRID